jgi:hypothetical protein
MSILHVSRATGVSHLVEKAGSLVARDPPLILPDAQSLSTQKPNKLVSSSAADRVCSAPEFRMPQIMFLLVAPRPGRIHYVH